MFFGHLFDRLKKHLSQQKRRTGMEALKRFVKEEEGATAIEYGLLAGLIALVIILAVTNLGKKINGIFTNVEAKLPG